MREQSYVVAGEEIEVRFYGGRSGDRAAAKVKCYELPALPKGLAVKLEKLEAESPGTEGLLRWCAWESATMSWWDWAEETARELGLGTVCSYGASGGYVGLDAFSEERVDRLVLEVNEDCKNCREPYDTHCDGKCLFDCTHFAPAKEDAYRTLQDLVRFLRECEESVRGEAAVARLTEELRCFVDAEWEERMAKRRR